MLSEVAQATLKAFQEVAAQHPELDISLVELDPPNKLSPNEASVTLAYNNVIIQAQLFTVTEHQVEV
jgi:hypothetical protein